MSSGLLPHSHPFASAAACLWSGCPFCPTTWQTWLLCVVVWCSRCCRRCCCQGGVHGRRRHETTVRLARCYAEITKMFRCRCHSFRWETAGYWKTSNCLFLRALRFCHLLLLASRRIFAQGLAQHDLFWVF